MLLKFEFRSLDPFFQYVNFNIPYNSNDTYHFDNQLKDLSTNYHFRIFCCKCISNFKNTIYILIKNEYSKDTSEYLNYWEHYELINNNFDVNIDDLWKSMFIRGMEKLWKNNSEYFPRYELKNYEKSIAYSHYMKHLCDYS